MAFLLGKMGQAEGWKESIPGHLPTFEMRRIAGGTVQCQGQKVEVNPFAIGVTEITWDIYDIFAYRLDITQEEAVQQSVIDSRPSKPYGAPDRGYGHQGFAALGMTMHAAEQFCKWLSEKTGKPYRVPTEAEWELAARGGATEIPSPLDDFAWNWNNSDDAAQAVQKLKPNAFGLYDMLGNVAEWVQGQDGRPVIKGGHFLLKPNEYSFGWRGLYKPEWQMRDAHTPKSQWWLSDGEFVGLRVVCDLP